MTVIYTNAFKKDFSLMQKRNLKMDKLKTVMSALEQGLTLEQKYNDHILKGAPYNGDHECHISPDWLLIYRPLGEMLIFVRTGSHSDLFR
jgi:mRNA interferase YafQ